MRNGCQLTGKKNIERYILGKHAEVTLEAPSGKYYTYQFRYPARSQNNEFEKGTKFVYVAVGHKKYEYVGMLKSDRKFYHTRASRYAKNSEQFKGAAYIVKMMNYDFETPMKLYHSGRCSVCGKKLTSPKSIAYGMGPKCSKIAAQSVFDFYNAR